MMKISAHIEGVTVSTWLVMPNILKVPRACLGHNTLPVLKPWPRGAISYPAKQHTYGRSPVVCYRLGQRSSLREG